MSYDVCLLDLQLEGVVLKLVEVQKLIYEAEHTVDVSLHDVQKPLVFLCH